MHYGFPDDEQMALTNDEWKQASLGNTMLRTIYTKLQQNQLSAAFAASEFPLKNETYQRIVEVIGLSEPQVRRWFQDERFRPHTTPFARGTALQSYHSEKITVDPAASNHQAPNNAPVDSLSPPLAGGSKEDTADKRYEKVHDRAFSNQLMGVAQESSGQEKPYHSTNQNTSTNSTVKEGTVEVKYSGHHFQFIHQWRHDVDRGYAILDRNGQ